MQREFDDRGPARPGRFLLIALVFVLMVPMSSEAGVYKYKDSNGKVIFTDSPPADVKTKQMKFRDEYIVVPDSVYKSYSQEDGTGVKERDTGKRHYSDIKVELYMTSWCPYCSKARAYIKSLGVKLLQYDIEKDPEKRKAMLRLGRGNSVPQIVVEGIVITGYAPSAIKRAVEARRLK